MQIEVCENCAGAIVIGEAAHVCDPAEVQLLAAVNAERKRLLDLDRFLEAALAYCDACYYQYIPTGDVEVKRRAMAAAWAKVRAIS